MTITAQTRDDAFQILEPIEQRLHELGPEGAEYGQGSETEIHLLNAIKMIAEGIVEAA